MAYDFTGVEIDGNGTDFTDDAVVWVRQDNGDNPHFGGRQRWQTVRKTAGKHRWVVEQNESVGSEHCSLGSDGLTTRSL